MSKKEIMKTIKMLAHSQGFYGRLLHNLEVAGEPQEFFDQFAHCADPVDFVMALEG